MTKVTGITAQGREEGLRLSFTRRLAKLSHDVGNHRG